ncbi:actin cytoskeleton-regulatory complex protein PAN1 [Musa acuminata AAA Group]|uniref:actin cytoskeleton-regulatory complex protein PAN1 n=1 Tax=Musa acuminata AAA Group TaxID=214697 RepID=UPI0031E2B728
MAARPNQVADMRVFDAYFMRADLDRDGRISGHEAVAFFQGANLPRQVLAQVWMYADQKRAGFLGREEFYNALRLITVAQRGIELTPEIVQAALKSPDAAKIPAPKINAVPDPASQMKFGAPNTHSSQMSPMGPTNQNPGFRPTNQNPGFGPNIQNPGFGPTNQNPGFIGQPPHQNTGMNQHAFPTGNNLMRPPQATPVAVRPFHKEVGQVLPGGSSTASPYPPGSSSSNVSTDWFSGRNSGALGQGTPQTSFPGVSSVNQDGFGVSNSGSAPGTGSKPQILASTATSVPSKPGDAILPSLQSDSRALVLAGNGFSSDSTFGGDAFSATQAKQEKNVSSFSSITTPKSSSIVPSISGSQNSSKPQNVDTWQSMALVPSSDNQLQQTQSPVKQSQSGMKQSTPAMTGLSGPVGSVGSTSSQPQLSWPKFTQSDIQRYLVIFIKVDTDRDGKITGEEARNLFLSWRLPREVLKQVWDLSDQDNDGMLSLREFCIALYLMERHREKCPLPAVLPESVRSDQTLLLATNQPLTGYGGPVSQSTPVQGTALSRPAVPAVSVKPQIPKPIPSQTDDTIQSVKKSKVPVLEKHLVDQLSKDERSTLHSKFQEASDADKKVQELEKEILDSKEKTEFYRSKMQELVLYKSRCDNRFNEITERASADKREVESLMKKYEEKYKQAGDVASKLTIEEATFRDIQEKKLEIYDAILKIEQGGTADGLLQARAAHIQKDLEELVKVLNERCKQYGLRSKPTSLIELPFGWQPGIQEGAADWDEDWDKFDEDGFVAVKELTIEVEKVVPTEKSKPEEVKKEKLSTEEVSRASSSNGENKTEKHSNGENETEKRSSDEDETDKRLNDENKTEKPSTTTAPLTENGSTNLDGDDSLAKSPSSPGTSALESPKDIHHVSVRHDGSPHANENSSDHDAAESFILEDKHAGEPSWGPTFDRTDDTDSVWSFNPKESDHQKRRQNFSFGSDDFGLFPPIKTDSPSAASVAGKEKGPFFDSVPSTPLFNSGFSPRFTDGPDDHSFDSFSQHDFFGTNDTGAFAQREGLSRFDSFRSTTDYSRGESLVRFDSIRSTADYNSSRGESFARFDSMRSTTDYNSSRGESFARFDSMRSTTDHSRGYSSFDGGDLFGSEPFKSSESHSPKKGTTNWDAF